MQVQGRVYFDHGLPAAEVRLRFYHRGFGGGATSLGAVVADADGAYVFTHKPQALPVNLEVRAVGADGAIEVSLTETMHNVSEFEVLNLVVPATVRPLATEYQRLSTDVGRYVDGGSLADAEEGTERRDLSLLHRSAGWDARLIAFASLADRLSPIVGVDRQAPYGMLRAGLPTEPLQLARVSRVGVRHALHKANEAGVTALSEKDIQTILTNFETFARTTRRELVGPGGLSSYGEMLAASGISEDDRDSFDEMFSAHRGTPEELWRKAGEAGLPVEPLRLTARLGYLTLNNAELVAALLDGIRGTDDLATKLVEQRLYQPQAWGTLLGELGRSEAALTALIPPAYTGVTTEERLAAYTADLARKVRRSYPTQVIAHMVSTDQLRLGANHGSVKADVATVLQRAAEVDGFSFGRTPLGAFIRDHRQDLLGGMSPERFTAAVKHVNTLHRLYQITPHDEALAILLEHGLTSAYDITAMPKEVFLRRYSGDGDGLLTREQGTTVYQKAEQVTTVIYTFFAAAKQLEHPPPVHVLSSPPDEVEAAKNNLIKHFPTMENLFGSLDYSECEHCRSVLSPAAYLVDILKFLDPDQHVWDRQVEEWLAANPGEPAPDRPFDVLAKRRPDIQALPLTCENTHTALPYIDIVNEILEYYLVHQQLGPEIAYDTGGANTADLVAEPQHLLKDAYDILQDARYPLTLPFNLWLETVRRFCDHFDAPLWQILAALRVVDELDPPPGDGYGYRAVFRERLGISPEEHAILTFQAPIAWHELYGYPDAATALTELASAKTLSRRLGVTYRELVAVLKTGFVNPRLDTLVELRNLGVDIEDVLRYLDQPGYPPFTPDEQTAFEEKLTPGGVAWLQQAFAAGDFAKILVLADPNPGGGFAQTVLRYADGTPVDAIALLTINLFVRLWRRLGWPIEETGRTLRTFLPRDPDPWTLTTIGDAMATALLGVAHYDTLSGLLKTGKKGRPKLVHLWSDLDDRTYAELFLTGSDDTRDPVFTDPLGHYLTDDTVLLHEHLPGLQAALNLTAEEISQILADANLDIGTAPLTLPTVSLLHRYVLLATLSRLPVAELIALEALSGLRPFTPLHSAPVTSIAQDHPYTQTQRFVEVAAIVARSGLRLADLDYLLRHRFDPVGRYRSAATPPLGLVRTLTAEITRIRAEHAIPADPLTFTDDVLQQKLALVFPQDVVATFLGMWQGTVEYVATVPDVVAADALTPADFAAHPQLSVRHNDVTQVQTLVYRGVLHEGERAMLLGEHPQQLFSDLLAQVRPLDFFAKHLLRTTVGATETGFLVAADFDTLFVPRPTELAEAAQRARRATLVAAFLPYLRHRLVHQFVIQTVATELGVEPELARALVAEPTVLDDPDADGVPLLASYTAIGDPGLDVTSDQDSVRLDGYLAVPATGAYRFFVRCELAGTKVVVRFDHLTDPMLRASAAADDAELSEYTTLQAGVLYGFTVDASDLGGRGITVSVQGELLPKGDLVDTLPTWPRGAVTTLHRAHLLVDKVIRLASELDLTKPELVHLSVHHEDFGGFDLGALPTRAGEDGPVETAARFGAFLRLADYLRLRDELAAQPDELVDLFAAARRVYPADAVPAIVEPEVRADLCARLAAITRRDPGTVEAAADLLGMVAHAAPAAGRVNVVAVDFANEQGIGRLWTVLTLAARLGVAPDALGRWATPTPDAAIAQNLRDTVKARYDGPRWRGVAQSVFDGLRRRRRDALVAHILHTKEFDRVEQLFEYFLVDPATEPVVRTSRLRLAISSVQTFVQRCQLNLEPDVPPSFIEPTHWSWMKRYRVWEANRKIFLWPENWLEPEWRDDKSHLFTELESTLLQSDLSNEHAETAFLGYLRGLQEIARLDVRAIHVEEKADPAATVLHVVARTFGSPHRYFYRTYSHQMWTPWVPVTADIQGDHLVLTKWRGRVHLFWVSFLEKGAKQVSSDKTPNELMDNPLSDIQPRRWVDVQLSWAEYLQGEWTAPESTGFQTWRRPKIHFLGNPQLPPFQPSNVFIHATVAEDDSLLINLTNSPDYLDYALRIVSKNGTPSVYSDSAPVEPPYTDITSAGRGRYTSEDEGLSVRYVERITTKNGQTTYSCPTTKKILHKGEDYTLVTHGDTLHGPPGDIGRLVSPFFYADDLHTFYIEPKLTQETTIQTGDGFVLATPLTMSELDDPGYWVAVEVKPQVIVGPGPVESIAAAAKFTLVPLTDWATGTDNLVRFGATLIGATGGVATGLIQVGGADHGV